MDVPRAGIAATIGRLRLNVANLAELIDYENHMELTRTAKRVVAVIWFLLAEQPGGSSASQSHFVESNFTHA